MNKGWLVWLAVSLLAACGEGSGVGSGSANPSGAPVYTMIVDAGSSGTRLTFYKVIPGQGGYPQVTLLDSHDFGDNGINDYLNGAGTIDPADWTKGPTAPLDPGYKPDDCNMTAATDNGGQTDVGPCVIHPLLDSMAKAIKAANVTPAQIKIELFATAGMRTMATFNGGGIYRCANQQLLQHDKDLR